MNARELREEIADLVVEGNVFFTSHVPHGNPVRWNEAVAIGHVQRGAVCRNYGYGYERREACLQATREFEYNGSQEREDILKEIRESANSKGLRIVDGEIDSDSPDMLVPRMYSMFVGKK